MKKAGWIVYRTIFGLIQLLVVWWVLAAISDANTRLIVAALGLIYTALSGGLVALTTMQLTAEIANEDRFHELMSLADPNRQPPDFITKVAPTIQTNWVTQVFLVLVALSCLLTVFGSLR